MGNIGDLKAQSKFQSEISLKFIQFLLQKSFEHLAQKAIR